MVGDRWSSARIACSLDGPKWSRGHGRASGGGERDERKSESLEEDDRSPPDLAHWGGGKVMNGELSPGTYRAKNGDLIHCRDDFEGHSQIQVEHSDGSTTLADLTAIRDAVRVSDDPDWPLRHPRFVGFLRFD